MENTCSIDHGQMPIDYKNIRYHPDNPKIWIATVYKDETPAMWFQENEITSKWLDGTIKHQAVFTKSKRDMFDQSEEINARNALINKVPNGDYFIILDSDEVLFGTLECLRAHLYQIPSNVIWIQEFLPNGSMRMLPRIVRKCEGMEYRYTHDQLFLKEVNLFTIPTITFQTVFIVHYGMIGRPH